MLKVKKHFLPFVFVFSVAILAGCGNGGSGEADGVVELDFAAWGNTDELQVYQRAIDAFNEEHDDIHVELQELPGNNYTETLTTRLQGGQAPDIFYAYDGDIINFINNGSVLDVADFLESDESYVTVDEFPEDLFGPAKQGDEIYALLPDANPLVFYYNIDLFEENSITTPQEYYEEGNWNWEAMEEVTSRLNEAGRYGFVVENGPFGLNSWIWSNGGSFHESEEVVIDQNPEAKEALEYVTANIAKGNFTYAGGLPEGQGGEAMFLSNQVGLVAAGRWLTPMFEEAGVNYDYIPWPTNTENQMEPAVIGVAYMAVNSGTDHPEEAQKFLSFYTSEEGQALRTGEGGSAIPAVQGVDEIVTDDPVPAHAEYLTKARDIGSVNGFETSLPGLNTELNDIYELMLLGDISVDEATVQLAEATNEMLAENED